MQFLVLFLVQGRSEISAVNQSYENAANTKQ